MVNKIFFSIASIFLLIMGTTIVSFLDTEGEYDIYAFSTGSPGGRTDSPGDMSNCFACHTGSFNSGNANVVISSNDLANGYVPGQTYNIQLDVSNTNAVKVGFEVTAEKDVDNSKVGTLILNDATQTQFVNSNAAITHTSAGAIPSSNAKNWSFSWTAPSAFEGDITFYAAFNCANGNGTTTGDDIYTTSFTVSENTTSINEFADENSIKIYPNPTSSVINIHTNKKILFTEIFGIDGKKITVIPNNNTINVQFLDKGVFILKVHTASEIQLLKFIKTD